MINVAPTVPGFYWAKWQYADEGTRDAAELTPSDEWEPVQVFENAIDPTVPEYLKVFVLGVQRPQSPANFLWGSRIEVPRFDRQAAIDAAVGKAVA